MKREEIIERIEKQIRCNQVSKGLSLWTKTNPRMLIEHVLDALIDSGLAVVGVADATGDDCDQFIAGDCYISPGSGNDCDGNGHYQCNDCQRYAGRGEKDG